jgi:phage portal protein BeeE
MSRPSFVLSAPGAISDATAARIKAQWETNFGGENYGRTAVLGDGLKPESFTINAADSQLIEQLGWTSEDICRAFGVPGYKIGVGSMPAYSNIEALDQAYYSQTLQEPIECIELLLDEGLELPTGYGTEFDLDGLLRMDTATQVMVLGNEIRAGYLAPNEARQRRGLPPVKGGESPLSQQQYFPLEALANREVPSSDPFAAPGAMAPFAATADDDESEKPDDEEESESGSNLERMFVARGDFLIGGHAA